MKKTILTIALLAASLGAHATKMDNGAGHAAPAATAPAVGNATVSVTGASTVAGAPLLLALNGAKASEPTFQSLFEAGQAHPKWKVTSVKTQGDKARLALNSASGKATLEMDVATSLVQGMKITKGTVISLVTESSGQSALIKFMNDKTPLGFMVNQNTKVR